MCTHAFCTPLMLPARCVTMVSLRVVSIKEPRICASVQPFPKAVPLSKFLKKGDAPAVAAAGANHRYPHPSRQLLSPSAIPSAVFILYQNGEQTSVKIVAADHFSPLWSQCSKWWTRGRVIRNGCAVLIHEELARTERQMDTMFLVAFSGGTCFFLPFLISSIFVP